MITELLKPDAPLWSHFLKQVWHDIYHRPEYVELAAKQDEGEGCAFWASHDDSALLVPLVLRPLPKRLSVPDAWFDGISPYGYASPLLLMGKENTNNAKLWRAFLDFCRETTTLSVFLRFNPLLPLPCCCGEAGTLVREGKTVVVDLNLNDEEAWRQTRENHRRDIRKLQKKGFRVCIDDWSAYEQFITLYWETMRRKGADEQYFFSRQYFCELREKLGDAVHLCTVRSPQDEVAAAGLFFMQGLLAQYHLSGTAQEYVRKSPIKLMFHEMRHWARSQGARVLHLGGGVQCREDALLNFKRGFSAKSATFYSLRVIADMDRYLSVSSDYLPRRKPVNPGLGYFPAYRRPERLVVNA